MNVFWQFLTVILVAALPPTQKDGNVLLKDDFATRAHRWALEQTAKVNVDYHDEALRMTISSPGEAVWSVPDFDLVLSQYRMTFSAEILKDSPESVVGAVFNYQDEENFYLLDVDSSGHYAIYLVEDGQVAADILAAGVLDTLQDETLLDFDMTINEGDFSFIINDSPLPTLHDDTFADGPFGLYARAGRGVMAASFDDLRVVDVINE